MRFKLFKLGKHKGITKVTPAIVFGDQIRTFNHPFTLFLRICPQSIAVLSRIVRYQMNYFLRIVLVLGISSNLAQAQTNTKNTAFTFGEELRFEVTYGWLDLAEAKLKVDKKAVLEGSKVHYKIDAFGNTKGAATLFGRVNDNWGTHLDTNSLLPRLSYRYIEEGKYRKNEKVYFDQVNKKAKVELYDRENRALKEVKEYKLPNQVQDLVSGFYLLRTMDLTKLRKGEQILITGFFDKEIYNLKLTFEGTEKIETNLGTKETYIFSPQLPKNKLFRGDSPVKVWVTKDQNKIPVKIKANLFIGSLNIDIASVNGLRNN
jgi:hypothetical protein